MGSGGLQDIPPPLPHPPPVAHDHNNDQSQDHHQHPPANHRPLIKLHRTSSTVGASKHHIKSPPVGHGILAALFKSSASSSAPLLHLLITHWPRSACGYLFGAGGAHREGTKMRLLTWLTVTSLLVTLVYFCLSSAERTSRIRYPQHSVQDNTDLHLYYKPHYNASGAAQRLPTTIIFGVRKGGTRAMLEFLKMHPTVGVSDDEMHFFDRPEIYERGLEWYRQQMPWTFPEQLTIEKTPAYFITPEAPQRIYKMNANVKLLLIVRNPVTRVISDYTQILSSRQAQNLPIKSFEQLVIDPSTGGVNLGYKAVQISIYHQHFRRWLEVFPLSQIHVIDGDKLIENPVSELIKVEDFLGIKHYLSEEHFYFNKTKGFYCMRRNATSERCLGSSKGRTHPKVDAELIRRLEHFYAPHNELFYNLTGRTFDWPKGYM